MPVRSPRHMGITSVVRESKHREEASWSKWEHESSWNPNTLAPNLGQGLSWRSAASSSECAGMTATRPPSCPARARCASSRTALLEDDVTRTLNSASPRDHRPMDDAEVIDRAREDGFELVERPVGGAWCWACSRGG